MKYSLLLILIQIISLSIMAQQKSKDEFRFGTLNDFIVITDQLAPILLNNQKFVEKSQRRYYSFTNFEESNHDSLSSDDKYESFLISQKMYHNLSTSHYNKIIKDANIILSNINEDTLIIKLKELEKYNKHGLISYLLSQQKSLGKDEALSQINEAIRINPYVEEYYLQKARFFDFQKDQKELLKLYDEILLFTVDKQAYHYLKFQIYIIEKKNDLALKELTNAIKDLETQIVDSQNIDSVNSTFELTKKKRNLGSYYYERYKLHSEEGIENKADFDLQKAIDLGHRIEDD